jgi:hypothetical protein
MISDSIKDSIIEEIFKGLIGQGTGHRKSEQIFE